MANLFANSGDPDQTPRLSITLLRVSRLNGIIDFVRVDVLRPSQPNGVMSSAVSLPNHTFTGQA